MRIAVIAAATILLAVFIWRAFPRYECSVHQQGYRTVCIDRWTGDAWRQPIRSP